MKPLAFILSSTLVLFVVIQFATSQDEKGPLKEDSPSPQVFESGPDPVALVELFTSQGCSSCPPADSWLAKKIKDDGLWKSFVPVAWHVDYWDRLGWPDPFGTAAHTRRQYGYREAGKVGSVYTPGFVVNGKEWRGFFQRQGLPSVTADQKNHPQNLKATLTGDQVKIEVTWHAAQAEATDATAWDIHVAVLGFDLRTAVPRGENAGRTLVNDFVALHHHKAKLDKRQASFTLPDASALPQGRKRRALAVWLAPAGQLAPIQATGGWLTAATVD